MKIISAPHNKQNIGICLTFLLSRQNDQEYVLIVQECPNLPLVGNFSKKSETIRNIHCQVTCSGLVFHFEVVFESQFVLVGNVVASLIFERKEQVFVEFKKAFNALVQFSNQVLDVRRTRTVFIKL